jgi:glycosyltransferase involved in cell wall biosynthesis
MHKLLSQIPIENIHKLLPDSIEKSKFKGLEELTASSSLSETRKRFYKLSLDGSPDLHLSYGEGLSDAYEQSKDFNAVLPDLTCKPLFLVKNGTYELFAQEFFQGIPIDESFEAGTTSDHEVTKILKTIESSFASIERPSTEEGMNKEFQDLKDSILNNDNFGDLDREYLKLYFLPSLEENLNFKNPTKRWSSGDLAARNILVNSNNKFKLIDYEFALETHFHCEDWTRLNKFSSNKFSENQHLQNLIQKLDPFLQSYLILRQLHLNKLVHTKENFRHFASEDLAHSILSLANRSIGKPVNNPLLIKGICNANKILEGKFAEERDNRELKEQELALERENRELKEQELASERENRELKEQELALERENRELKEQELALERENRELKEQELALERENRERKEQELALERENRELKEQELALERENRELKEQKLSIKSDKIQRMQSSFSWKVTAPLRFMRRFGNYIRNNLIQKEAKVRLPQEVVVSETSTKLNISSIFEFPIASTGKQFKKVLRSETSMNLHWLIPDFGIGSGGHTNIFRMISWLEGFGHNNTIWICGGSKHGTAEKALEIIRTKFFPLNANVNFLHDPQDCIPEGDGLICTSFDTCYYGRAIEFNGARFYFVQDFEPEFFPKGSYYFLAKETYKFGMHCITNGKWMAKKIELEGATCSGWFQQAFDPAHYYPNKNKNTLKDTIRIAAYIRFGTSRRLSELIVFALNKLAKERNDFEVMFFGDNHLPLNTNFPNKILSVLSPSKLGDLYRSCDIGCVFSGTNYSLIPIEMMASGLPILEFDGENIRSTFPRETIYLAKPAPEDIKKALSFLISNPDRRKAQAKEAINFVKNFSWQDSARSVEKALQKVISNQNES